MLEYIKYFNKDALEVADELGQLYKLCMSAWPYCILPTIDCVNTIKMLAKNTSYIVWVGKEEGQIIGATSGITLPKDFVPVFKKQGIDTDTAFWVTQMTIPEKYRGRGLSTALVDLRETDVRALGYKSIVFTSILRPDAHPLQVSAYKPLDGMWEKRGYVCLRDAELKLTYLDALDQPKKPTEKTFKLWVKDLS